MSSVVTRFPPSPTGFFHIGSARTALFNYLFAAHNAGTMFLRFEDTDRDRSKKEYENDILDGLSWLGIPYELPQIFRQSERTAIYQGYCKQLLDTGLAYEAEAGTVDPSKKVIRFKNPNKKVTFTDLIRGEVSFDTTDLEDFVIARSIDLPLYHLAVVVDDREMGVTHVIRGEDHISNTPRQILILEALGFPRPQYAHIPLILAPDRSKLSKRHGAISLSEYRKEGYLPESLVNYLALLGWNPGTNQEIFSLEELVKVFDLTNVHKNGAVFEVQKLKWFNSEYQKKLSPDAQTEYKKTALPELEQALGDRITWNSDVALRYITNPQTTAATSAELVDRAKQGELDYLFVDPKIESKRLVERKSNLEDTKTHLAHLLGALEHLETFTEMEIKNAIWEYATAHGRGAVLWPFRYALSGMERSPDPFIIASVVGKETTLGRIRTALQALES